MKKKIIIVFLLAIVTFSCYALKVIGTEDLHTSRNSFAYFIAINSKTIKNVPVINNISEPDFYYSCGDGPKPGANQISYESSATTEKILKNINIYLKDSGYTLDKDQRFSIPMGKLYSKKGSLVEVIILDYAEKGYRKVMVIEYY